jgi:hypothetical protein
VSVANAAFADEGLSPCTVSQIKGVIDHCCEQGLLNVKHSDVNGQLQQYFKTSPDFDDLEAYLDPKMAQHSHHNGIDGTAQRWWTKDSNGEYHPDGPAPEAREYFKPIIERFLKGLPMKDRIWAQGFDIARL